MKITKKGKKMLRKNLDISRGWWRIFYMEFYFIFFPSAIFLKVWSKVYLDVCFLSFSLMDVFTDAFSARKFRFSFIGRNKIIKLTLSFSIVNSVRCGQSHVRVQASIPEARFHKEDLELIYPYIWVWYTWKRIILLKRML